jgi:hypothetical protein
MDSSSDNESKYNEFMENEKRLDEMEERAEREKCHLPKLYNFNKKETKKYYDWIQDCETSPGFALSWYEFIDKINKSRKARNSKRKMIHV